MEVLTYVLAVIALIAIGMAWYYAWVFKKEHQHLKDELIKYQKDLGQ